MNGNQQDVQRLVDDSRRAGRQLSAALHSGVQPQPVSVPLAMQQGEQCFGQTPVTVLQFTEGDGTYVKRSGGWVFGGGLIGGVFNAANAAANTVGNARRRADAARDMQGTWRPIRQGHLFLTNRRWSLNADRTWLDWWFNGIRMSHCDGRMIVLELVGNPPTGLVIPQPDYWFVLFHKLAYNQIPLPPPPSDEPQTPPPGPTPNSGPGWTHRNPN